MTSSEEHHEKKKHILFLTGKRGGWDCILPMILDLKKDYKVSVIFCDQHMFPEFGRTAKKFSKQLPQTVNCWFVQSQFEEYNRTMELSHIAKELPHILEFTKPDLAVAYGDRDETLHFALACYQQNIPVMHLQAGDKSGNRDDDYRKCISILSSWYGCSISEHAYNLAELGIYTNPSSADNSRVCISGDQHLDGLHEYLDDPFDDKEFEKLGDYCIYLYHSTPPMHEEDERNVRAVHEALKWYRGDVICIQGCSDVGWERVWELQKKAAKPNWSMHENIAKPDFIRLLAGADFLIGNSSCGIIETPSLGVPSIDIGRRQDGRVACRDLTKRISSGDPKELEQYIITMMEWTKNCMRLPFNLYGDGRANERLCKFIRTNIFEDAPK